MSFIVPKMIKCTASVACSLQFQVKLPKGCMHIRQVSDFVYHALAGMENEIKSDDETTTRLVTLFLMLLFCIALYLLITSKNIQVLSK